MQIISFLLSTLDGYKTYLFATLAVLCGLIRLISNDHCGEVSETFEALMLVFGGVSIVGLRHAVAKVAKTDVRNPVQFN
jgi:hypothetical protein